MINFTILDFTLRKHHPVESRSSSVCDIVESEWSRVNQTSPSATEPDVWPSNIILFDSHPHLQYGKITQYHKFSSLLRNRSRPVALQFCSTVALLNFLNPDSSVSGLLPWIHYRFQTSRFLSFRMMVMISAATRHLETPDVSPRKQKATTWRTRSIRERRVAN